MARLLLQRHTEPNIDPKICYGVSDIELHTEFELSHLPEVLKRLGGLEISKIYSSPLQRCLKLAEHIREHLHLEQTTVDSRLMELDFGEWELVSWDAIYQRDQGRAWFDDYLNCKTPNGESFQELLVRAKSFLSEIRALGEDTIVVTHSGFIRAAMVAEGKVALHQAFDIKIEYGSLTEL